MSSADSLGQRVALGEVFALAVMCLLGLRALERPLVDPGVTVGVANRAIRPGGRAGGPARFVLHNLSARAVCRALARVGFLVSVNLGTDGVRKAVLVARILARTGDHREAAKRTWGNSAAGTLLVEGLGPHDLGWRCMGRSIRSRSIWSEEIIKGSELTEAAAQKTFVGTRRWTLSDPLRTSKARLTEAFETSTTLRVLKH